MKDSPALGTNQLRLSTPEENLDNRTIERFIVPPAAVGAMDRGPAPSNPAALAAPTPSLKRNSHENHRHRRRLVGLRRRGRRGPAGAEVTLLERTDMLLGTGLVGGIFRNNGRFTAAEEMIAMGGGEMFHAMEACKTHTNIEFPGHHHASLYNIATIEPEVQRALAKAGVKVEYQKRITDVDMDGRRIVAVRTKKNEEQ